MTLKVSQVRLSQAGREFMSSKLSRAEKNELLAELEESFLRVKKELGFKASLDELDRIFFIRDSILAAGFVSNHVDRQICGRIVDTYMSWNNYFQNLVMSPGSMIFMNEGKMLSEAERKDLLKIVSEIMAIVSTNTVLGLTHDEKEEATFIDDAVKFWNTSFKPRVTPIVNKINSSWKK